MSGFLLTHFQNIQLKIMLRSNSFQLIIPVSKRSAMLSGGSIVGDGVSQAWQTVRFMTVVGEVQESYIADYHGFKACFDCRNQENIRVWQMPI
jgi:hypothetical protein